jgi:hypothetical protein
VVVIPGCQYFTDYFPVFDLLIEAINKARRNARDYVTDVALEKLDDRLADEAEKDWSVSVNCAHLHPNYGERTPEQVLQDLKEEEEEGEIDVNLIAYKEKRLAARKSPYPTIVLEVRSVPPPDFSMAPPLPPVVQKEPEDPKGQVSNEDIQKLEAMFGLSASMNHPTKELSPEEEEELFYSKLGENLNEISSVTPLVLAQNWLAKNDPTITPTPIITESEEMQVDAGYEYIFLNIAMMKEHGNAKQYLVMPHFLTASATSFDKVCDQVEELIQLIPDLKDEITISTFHPEHIDSAKRSPVPIYALEWKNGD